MIVANTTNLDSRTIEGDPKKERRLSQGEDPIVLTDIYNEGINIVTWHRDLPASLQSSVQKFLASNPGFEATMTVSPKNVSASISEAFGDVEQPDLVEDISELVHMFCDLFQLSNVGLRLSALDKAMCPKFHVDRIPCRLVTTYQGIATEWLPHAVVDRTKLGTGSNGLSDSESGLYPSESDIQQLACGDVALLKGEHWYDNEKAGLVHRSPSLPNGGCRLLLTLDFA